MRESVQNKTSASDDKLYARFCQPAKDDKVFATFSKLTRLPTNSRTLITENIVDVRRGKNAQLPLPDLLRQSICSRLAGYEDLNDAERLSQDPTFRLIGSEKILGAWGSVAFAPTLVRDRGAEPGGELGWSELDQSGTAAKAEAKAGAARGEPVAYNLGNLWRRLALPRRIDNWSLTSLQQGR